MKEETFIIKKTGRESQARHTNTALFHGKYWESLR